MPYPKGTDKTGRAAFRGEVHAGMGAIPHAAGVAFRVWAPNATAVSVVGTFNDFKPGAHPMARENDEGYWYADVPGAKGRVLPEAVESSDHGRTRRASGT